MATSSRATGAAAAVALALAGCGEAATTHRPTGSGGSSFAWLAAGDAPAVSPPQSRLAAGQSTRPPGWRAVRGDPGSVSFAQLSGGAIVGYLNATPRSGAETLSKWRTFRVAHNAEEGDRDVRATAAVTGLSVGTARVSCVLDNYRTSLSRYREIACLVGGSRATTVLVGAAPPSDWARQQPIIERAIAAFVAS